MSPSAFVARQSPTGFGVRPPLHRHRSSPFLRDTSDRHPADSWPAARREVMACRGASFGLLSRLPLLEELWLGFTLLDDADLSEVAGLRHLRSLRLFNPNITDKGLAALAGLPSLGELLLAGAPVGDAGMEHVGRLSSLRTLDLQGTKITDAGLEDVARLSSLERLNLSATSVTDAGLRHLEGLSHLRELTLCCDVTMRGVQRLQAKLPQCVIYY
jgi:hypothetical protein